MLVIFETAEFPRMSTRMAPMNKEQDYYQSDIERESVVHTEHDGKIYDGFSCQQADTYSSDVND